MKAEDFITGLRETQLFSETEIDSITIDCEKNYTIGNVVRVCDALNIGLSPENIDKILEHMTGQGELILSPAVRKRILEKASEYHKWLMKMDWYSQKQASVEKVQAMVERSNIEKRQCKEALEILLASIISDRQECIDFVTAFDKEAKA
jgi:hypothetical protein